MMKLSEHIDLRELVPPESIEQYGDKAAIFIDDRLPVIIEAIRKLCGDKPVTLNNWHIHGIYKYRGYRPEHCTIGATKSMHRVGMAADFTVKGINAEQVRVIIRKNAAKLFKLGLRRIEAGVSWVHIDLKETGLKTIYEFLP